MDTSDHLEILNLYSRYAHTIDRGDVAGWCGCFVEDGCFEIPARGVTARGTDQLAAFARAYSEGTRAHGSEKHVTSNILIETADGAVAGQAYLCMVVDGTNDTPSHIRTTGRYRDVLIKADAIWMFASRTLDLDGPLGSATVSVVH